MERHAKGLLQAGYRASSAGPTFLEHGVQVAEVFVKAMPDVGPKILGRIFGGILRGLAQQSGVDAWAQNGGCFENNLRGRGQTRHARQHRLTDGGGNLVTIRSQHFIDKKRIAAGQAV